MLLNSLPLALKKVFAARAVQHTRHFEGVLGTSLELQFKARNLLVAKHAETSLLEEIRRLEKIFSRFMVNSELNRLLATQHTAFLLSHELESVLQAALYWQERSLGAFHLGADALGQLWKSAELRGFAPTTSELEAVLKALKAPILKIGAKSATVVSSLPLNLNAIAKGFIAEMAAQKAFMVEDVSQVLVNLGGDLRHFGTEPIVVSIANPFSNADNALPLEKIRLCNQGLATSGGSHRGYTVSDTRVSHLLDPRTGLPVQHIVAASVVAPDAMTADVLATIFSVLTLSESLELANSIPSIGCCLVGQNQIIRNEFWQSHLM
jgi:FAD:protein FMN transferase